MSTKNNKFDCTHVLDTDEYIFVSDKEPITIQYTSEENNFCPRCGLALTDAIREDVNLKFMTRKEFDLIQSLELPGDPDVHEKD